MTLETVPTSTAVPRRRRGCLFIVRRGLLALVVLLMVVIVVGFIFQTVATESDKRSNLPLGQLIEVNGHNMHLYCLGEGSPTVVLEAGAYGFSREWYWIQEQLAPTHHVCAYDRVHMGWSEASDAPRSLVQAANELHTLLANADITPPYLLVGHSYGGIRNRVFTAQYPDEVIGLVMVDTALDIIHFENSAEYDDYKRSNDLLNVPLGLLIRIGLGRLSYPATYRAYGYPDAVADEIAAIRSRNFQFDGYYEEGLAAMYVNTQQSTAASDMGARPMAVLWASVLPRQLSAEEQIQYTAWQGDVAAYSSNSQTIFVAGADHGSIIGSQEFAQQVTDAILSVIDSAQTGAPLSN